MVSGRKTYRFSFSDINLTVRQVENFMGYREGESDPHFAGIISEALEDVSAICDIRAEYRIFRSVKFSVSEKTVEFGGHNFDIKKIVYGQLKRADSIAVFLVTAGPGPGERSKLAMSEGDPLRSYVYDAIGSELVEAAADIMQADLLRNVKEAGLGITNRFSPGYCGWSVNEQHKLFNLMPYNYCGIRLTPSALMDPVKSVSGFIGIGTNVKFLPYTCSLCDMKDCIYRRTGR